jgi:hypothetical protein
MDSIGSLEPAERFRADRLQHEAFDVDAHFIPQLGHRVPCRRRYWNQDQERDVVEADTGPRDWRRAEEGCGRVLAAPVVGPCEAAFDQTGLSTASSVSLDAPTTAPAGRTSMVSGATLVSASNVIAANSLSMVTSSAVSEQHRLHPDGNRLCIGDLRHNKCCCKQRCRRYSFRHLVENGHVSPPYSRICPRVLHFE